MKKLREKGKRFIKMDSQIQIIGDNSVLVDGCNKILEYNEIMVKLKTWDLTVQIWGMGLTVSDYGSDTVWVYGKIRSIELQRNG